MSFLNSKQSPLFLKEDNINLAWDTKREPFFLGGLLTIRSEIQLLRASLGLKPVRLFADPSVYQKSNALVDSILGDIPDLHFAGETSSISENWPHTENQNDPYFSHGSFFRIPDLIKSSGQRPTLSWSKSLRSATRAKLASLEKKPMVTVHLKNVPNLPGNESNADQESWRDFFEYSSEKNELSFLLLGNDDVDANILKLPNVRHASEFNLTLSEQCTAISLSDGFMGMASGFCQAAIFEDLPYVVFKNPPHHLEQMDAELGIEDFFPFAKERQKLWRKWDNRENLTAALSLLLPDLK